jgi:hypothetical protein
VALEGDLVVAAVTEGTRTSVVPPDTGSLRGDLLSSAVRSAVL